LRLGFLSLVQQLGYGGQFVASLRQEPERIVKLSPRHEHLALLLRPHTAMIEAPGVT
jgi:hypothetical protein